MCMIDVNTQNSKRSESEEEEEGKKRRGKRKDEILSNNESKNSDGCWCLGHGWILDKSGLGFGFEGKRVSITFAWYRL